MECAVTANFSSTWGSRFSIAKLAGIHDDEMIRYNLYRPTNETFKYLNYLTKIDGEARPIAIYYYVVSSEYGIRIPSLDCYRKLNALFNSSTEFETISIVGDVVYNKEDSIFGYLYINDIVTKKKRTGLGSHPWALGK